MGVDEDTSARAPSFMEDVCEMRSQIKQLHSAMELLKSDNEQNSMQIKEIQKVLADMSCVQAGKRGVKDASKKVTFADIEDEQTDPARVAAMKLELLQEIDKTRKQTKSDITDANMNVINVDKATTLSLEAISPEVNDLQSISVHSMEDSESWKTKLDDLARKMQSDQSNMTHTIHKLKAKVERNSILMSQLLKPQADDVDEPRKWLRRRHASNSDSGASSLDVIVENGDRESSSCQNGTPRLDLDSVIRQNSFGADSLLGSKSDGQKNHGLDRAASFSPIRDTRVQCQHDLSLSARASPGSSTQQSSVPRFLVPPSTGMVSNVPTRVHVALQGMKRAVTSPATLNTVQSPSSTRIANIGNRLRSSADISPLRRTNLSEKKPSTIHSAHDAKQR